MLLTYQIGFVFGRFEHLPRQQAQYQYGLGHVMQRGHTKNPYKNLCDVTLSFVLGHQRLHYRHGTIGLKLV